MKKSAIVLVFLFLASIFLAACGEPTATPAPPAPTPTPLPPDAKTIAQKSADRIKTLNGLHFVVDIKAGQVNILQGISFKRAEGDYVKPNRFRAKLRVSLPIGQVDAETVGVEAKQWLLLRNLNANWQELPPGVGFRADILFDPDKGLSALVVKAQNLQLVGTETVDGVESYRIKGVAPAADIGPVSSNTLGKFDVDFEAWVGKNDSLLRQLTLKEISTTTEASSWLLNFSKFDETVTIEPPIKQ
jgi:hypothetical protein